MKVLVSNYRYFVSGGPERYMFSLKQMLENNGHQFIPFSVAYTRNEATDYQKYFMDPPGDPSKVYFRELNLSLTEKIKFALNVIYSFKATSRLNRLFKDTRPDIMQTLQIHTFLSYSIIDAAKKYGLPIVSRMSNYQLMCPAEHFLRDQQVCEECKKSLCNAIRYKCIQNSAAGSAIKAAALKLHRMKKTFDKVDRFIVPSKFLRSKMIEYGFPAEKIVYLPSFINTNDFTPEYSSDGYIAYSGRIAAEKGVRTMIDGFAKTKSKPKLYIIGNNTDPEGMRIRQYVQEKDISNVEFLGYQPISSLKEILKKALFTLCPSQWYENTPMSIYESFALGKPVIGANIGSIPEQIVEGKTGLLFKPNDSNDLSEKINYLIDRPKLIRKMGREARNVVERFHSPEVHYNQLMQLYEQLI